MTTSPVSGNAFARSVQTVSAREPGATRIEADSLGPLEIPADADWGVHTARALTNFAINGRPIAEFSGLVQGFACVSQAAARANADIRSLPTDRAALIDAAAEEIKRLELLDQFVVDVIQGRCRHFVLSAFAAREFERAVRDHLLGVHVCRVDAGLMEREDVRIAMEPGHLSGEDPSEPRFSRDYHRPTDLRLP